MSTFAPSAGAAKDSAWSFRPARLGDVDLHPGGDAALRGHVHRIAAGEIRRPSHDGRGGLSLERTQASGNLTRKTAPFASFRLVTSISPLCASTIVRTMERPMPIP